MPKMQKAGFVIFACTFIVTGAVCLVAGFAADSLTLRIMGLVWLPLGVFHLVLVLSLISRGEGAPGKKDVGNRVDS